MRAPALFCLLLTVGCARGPGGPDVLFVTVDTLRRDHVSAYGSPHAGTGTIDALAAQGALFTEHYTTAATTGPAHASLFSGLHPRAHGVRRNGVALDPAVPSLPRALRAAGYETAAFVAAAVVGSRFGFAREFGVFDEAFDLGETLVDGAPAAYERDAGSVVSGAVEFLERAGDGPVFLWVHLFDPHREHRRPRAEWPPASELEGATIPAAEPYHSPEEVRDLRRGYLAEVRYLDRELARLLAAWDARPRGREGVVAFTADHGEALGEHGYVGHSLYLYQEQSRVPLVVRHPSRVPSGERVSSVTSAIDLAATVLDLAGVVSAERIGGESLLRHIGEDAPDALAYALAERPNLPGRRAPLEAGLGRVVREGAQPKGRLLNDLSDRAGGAELDLVMLVVPGWKYVWAEDVPDELYDLVSDPLEARNVAADERDRLLQLHARVERWRAETAPVAGPPPGAEGVTREVERLLEAMGYGR